MQLFMLTGIALTWNINTGQGNRDLQGLFQWH